MIMICSDIAVAMTLSVLRFMDFICMQGFCPATVDNMSFGTSWYQKKSLGVDGSEKRFKRSDPKVHFNASCLDLPKDLSFRIIILDGKSIPNVIVI